ncbi:methionine--tRNA ligase [Pyrus ussuriensis x Pyrus communis]|uniref:Methionine--tRNA ligase n=1 Tax=Pyrus ussuriensis x Pyrus communis TaxID=2448454 RepID=A0A5N5FBH2_9ROSA|nr:methionine--tRNA ligase [Pyrus ussuriensis x Pyrus communis]
MQNRKVRVLCNLKPANMRGIKSEAMVLAASNSDHTTVELVEPPEGAQIGEKVTFLGFVGEPDEVLNPEEEGVGDLGSGSAHEH